MSWFSERNIASFDSELFTALADAPCVRSTSTSIAPTVSVVQNSGLPAKRLGAFLDAERFEEAQRAILRVAAMSMLQEGDSQIAYGWTHCLTIPLALLQNADVSKNRGVLCAIAATHVLAFRATLGKVKLDPNFSAQPTRPFQDLIDEAALHRDAHVAKYMLACLDAAALDAPYTTIYFAAAERLLDWWRARAISKSGN